MSVELKKMGKGPREVEVAFLKYRIVSVNVSECKFTAVFSLHMRWHDPNLTADDIARSKAWMSDWEPSWTPRLDFLNETDTVERFRYNFDTDNEGFVRYFARYRGEFYEPYSLYRFPFDRHFLNIRLSTLFLTKDVVFKPYAGKANTMETNFLADWRLPDDPLDIVIDPVPEQEGYYFARASLRCKVERASEFYLWNICLVMFLIGLLCSLSMLFDPEELGDRLSVTLTMILTAVAFKFVVVSNLPQIPYQTLMDKYILCSFTFLAIIGVQNALARVLVRHLPLGSPIPVDFDWICLVSFLGAWILGHLISLIIVLSKPTWIYTPYENIRTAW